MRCSYHNPYSLLQTLRGTNVSYFRFELWSFSPRSFRREIFLFQEFLFLVLPRTCKKPITSLQFVISQKKTWKTLYENVQKQFQATTRSCKNLNEKIDIGKREITNFTTQIKEMQEKVEEPTEVVKFAISRLTMISFLFKFFIRSSLYWNVVGFLRFFGDIWFCFITIWFSNGC